MLVLINQMIIMRMQIMIAIKVISAMLLTIIIINNNNKLTVV